MLFKPEFIPLLESGRKTQTRRLVKEGDDVIQHYVIQGVFRNGRLLWRLNNTYAVQPGRGKKAVGRVRVTLIRRRRFEQMTMHDAIAEGADASLDGHMCLVWARRTWNKTHKVYGTRAQDNPDVWVLTLEWVT